MKGGITDFFRRVGEAVLGIWKVPGKLKRRVRISKTKPVKRPREEVPGVLRDFFGRRYVGWPEYVMLKAQLAILALFVITVVYIVLLPAETLIFVSLLLAFSVYLAYLAATQFRRAFRRDYRAYLSFIAMCIAIAWVFVLALRHSPIEFSLESIYLSLVPPVATIVFVFVAFLAFRLKYGRNFTYGVVEQVRGRLATVRVSYDICSNVKAGLYTVESFVKVKQGDRVRLSVERPMLGLRGAKVSAVLGGVK